MKIGIIGAGMIGASLARRLAGLGHAVSIANSRGPETLGDLAADTGATPVTVHEAARAGEIVVVAVPERAVPDLPADLFHGVAAEVVVVDTGNYYPSRDGHLAAIDAGQPESAWVADHLGRPVIKVFNTIYFKSLLEKGAPAGSADRIAIPVAGDPADARARVIRLVEQLGFDGVDAGSLDESWRQQPGTPCYGRDFDAPRLRDALAAAERSRVAEYRKAADDAMRARYTASPDR
jgi:predicted dinucleotide-binding enzyme